jgi:nucleoside-diphosphate-sugar epimerase
LTTRLLVTGGAGFIGASFVQLPPSQAEYVTCLRGAVFDVVVDMRVGSPSQHGTTPRRPSITGDQRLANRLTVAKNLVKVDQLDFWRHDYGI